MCWLSRRCSSIGWASAAAFFRPAFVDTTLAWCYILHPLRLNLREKTSFRWWKHHGRRVNRKIFIWGPQNWFPAGSILHFFGWIAAHCRSYVGWGEISRQVSSTAPLACQYGGSKVRLNPPSQSNPYILYFYHILSYLYHERNLSASHLLKPSTSWLLCRIQWCCSCKWFSAVGSVFLFRLFYRFAQGNRHRFI